MSTRRRLDVIAREIEKDWTKITPYAKPYLAAMLQCGDISGNFINDSCEDVVRYFLCNANTWKGDKAKRIKAELKTQLAETK